MRLGTLLLAIAATTGLSVAAYGQEATSVDSLIGLVDIQQIFRDHKPFADQIKEHQDEGQATQDQLAKKELDLQQKVEQLQGLKQGTKEFTDLQKKAQKLADELRETSTKAREAFGQKQLVLNVELHKTIRAAIERVARERKLKLVFNRTKQSLDSKNPSELLAAINQPVLYEDGIDITPDVLKILDAESAASAPNEGKKASDKKPKTDEKKGDEKGKKPKDGFLDIDVK
jgi:Skp family chaperone for outer membrane proteins